MINKIKNIDKVTKIGLTIVILFIVPLITSITYKVVITQNIIFQIMTNKDIVLTALNKYLIEISTKNEIHNFDTIEKTENLINYIK